MMNRALRDGGGETTPAELLREAAKLRAPSGTALYVHLPFCAAKCSYCDFYSLPAEGQDLSGVLQVVLLELERRAPVSPRTVFIGGGTPSIHPTAELVAFLDALDAHTGWRTSAEEVTVECNPESLDPTKAEALRAAGVTRLSIGFQSLDESRLALFGRVHDRRQSFAAFAAARAAGFERLSVDLIYAAPGQTPADWRRELEEVLALGPDHLSAYNLTFEDGTALGTRFERGELASAGEEAELEMFWDTHRLCADAGLSAYEISNFARPGQACLHNIGYWRNQPYVGVGPGAVSRIGELRFGNPRALGPWRAAAEARRDATAWCERSSPLARLGETWWLGLRLNDGVDPDEARATSGYTATGDDPAVGEARRLEQLGLLERAGARFRLSERGLPLADGVGRCFIELAAKAGPAQRT